MRPAGVSTTVSAKRAGASSMWWLLVGDDARPFGPCDSTPPGGPRRALGRTTVAVDTMDRGCLDDGLDRRDRRRLRRVRRRLRPEAGRRAVDAGRAVAPLSAPVPARRARDRRGLRDRHRHGVPGLAWGA